MTKTKSSKGSASVDMELPRGEIFFGAYISGSEDGVIIVPLDQSLPPPQIMIVDKIHQEDDENLVVTIRIYKPKKVAK